MATSRSSRCSCSSGSRPRRRHDRVPPRPQARARLPAASRAALPHHAEDRRAGRGDLRPARRQGDHPGPFHRRGAGGHAVPRGQLASPAAAFPGLRHRGRRSLGGLLPGSRLPRRRELPPARPRSRTRSASRSAPPPPSASSRSASGRSGAARRGVSGCVSQRAGCAPPSSRGVTELPEACAGDGTAQDTGPAADGMHMEANPPRVSRQPAAER